MDGAFYLIVNGLIGVLLLFFGLKLMKFAVAVMGFVLGFSIVGALVQSFAWPEWMLWAIPLAAGIVLAAVAFAFYRFAITLSISLFFVNLAFGIAQAAGQGSTESWVIAIIVGILAFFLVTALKLVDVFFALATSAQGASLLLGVLYGLLNPEATAFLRGYVNLEPATHSWLWLLGWIVLVAIGFAFQLRNRPKASASE